MPHRILFIDRDGTLIREPADEQIDSFEKLRFTEGMFQYLGFIRRHTDFRFVMVSNQDGLGTPSFPEETFWPVHNFILQALEDEGITFDEQLIDRHFPEDNSPMRKPGTGMLTHYLQNPDIDMAGSYVIGDRQTDRQLAENLGCKALILGEDGLTWKGIAERLYAGERIAEVRRTTRETDILVRLDLDGTGRCDISTGLGFFDHMLEQIGHHGQMDVTIHVNGDLSRTPRSLWANVSARHSATSVALPAMVSACPWTTAFARWHSTSEAGRGWCGMPTSIARKSATCPLRCSCTSSRA